MQICLDGKMHLDGSVIALGMFDGVHVGHQILLQKAKAVATELKLPLVVETFARHPLALISPHQVPPLLTTFEERAALMAKKGVDVLSAPVFTAQLRDMPPEEYIGRLVRQWKPKAVVVGFNYSFGSKGAGTPAFLKELGHALGFHTYVVPGVRIGGKPVSATRIRGMLQDGNVTQARFLLGWPYTGQVALKSRIGERCTFTWVHADKQRLPAGKYRAALSAGGHNYPLLTRVNRDGSIDGMLPTTLILAGELMLRFIAEIEPSYAF